MQTHIGQACGFTCTANHGKNVHGRFYLYKSWTLFHGHFYLAPLIWSNKAGTVHVQYSDRLLHHFTFLCPSNFSKYSKAMNSSITVRENVFSGSRTELEEKKSISKGFGSALVKLANFCRFNALNSNPSWEPQTTKRAIAKFQWNRFRHLLLFLSRWCQWGPEHKPLEI